MINRSSDQIGLFRNTQNSSTITAVGLLNMNITGRSLVGGLVGANFGTITKSYTTSVVFKPSSTGGGLVGNNSRSGNITNSCATGDVNSKGHNIGGLVGFNSGNIINSCATGDVNGGRSDVGGLAGENRGSITTSYATGNVNGQGNINNIGGLVGYNNDAGTITNSYATGSVSGAGSSIGGLVGAMFNDSTIMNSYATGSVSGSDASSNVGGLVGQLNQGIDTISNSYWLEEAGSSLNSIGDGSSLSYSAERTIMELTSPTAPGASSTDAYYTWLSEVWDFGSSNQFPTIRNSANDILTNNLPLCTLSIPNEDGDSVKHAMDIDKDNDGWIEICDLEGLDAIRNNLRGSGSTEQGCRSGGCIGFELARSLDFTDNNDYRRQTNKAKYTVSDYEDDSDTGWQPIGESRDASFIATFDGDGYTISNLMINSTEIPTGLFRFLAIRAEILNLGLLNVKIKGGDDVGSLVGFLFASRASITNSFATGSVSGNDEVGGLVGDNNGNITNSSGAVKVNGNNQVGGLVGNNEGNITYSYATGDVSGSNDEVGGLAGNNRQRGRITNSYATGTVSGNWYLGGLVGRNYAVGDNMITNSYATGNVSGITNVGGLVGRNDFFMNLGTGIVTNSYATGDVSASFSNDGGLIGLNEGTLNDSYWLSGSASIGGYGVENNAEKTAEELKSPTAPGTTTVPTTATYYNWSEDDWDFGTSDQYPVLKDRNGNLIPGQGTTLTGSSLRESLRELEIPEVRTTSSQIFGVSTNNYVVTIFLPAGTTEWQHHFKIEGL